MTAFKVGDTVQIICPADLSPSHALWKYNLRFGKITARTAFAHNWWIVLDGEPKTIAHFVNERRLRLAPRVSVGDRVRCKQLIMFYDGEQHNAGDEFIVNEQTHAYYQWALERGDYELLPPLPQYFALIRKWMPNNMYDSHRWYSHGLAECIVYAQMQVEENGCQTATVHQGEEIRSLFISVSDLTGKVICIKSAECNATIAEVADALRKYVCGELGE